MLVVLPTPFTPDDQQDIGMRQRAAVGQGGRACQRRLEHLDHEPLQQVVHGRDARGSFAVTRLSTSSSTSFIVSTPQSPSTSRSCRSSHRSLVISSAENSSAIWLKKPRRVVCRLFDLLLLFARLFLDSRAQPPGFVRLRARVPARREPPARGPARPLPAPGPLQPQPPTAPRSRGPPVPASGGGKI